MTLEQKVDKIADDLQEIKSFFLPKKLPKSQFKMIVSPKYQKFLFTLNHNKKFKDGRKK